MNDPRYENVQEVDSANETFLIEPKFKAVVLINDDYTTMNFVTALLISVFDKSIADANNIMMNVHNNGEGVCGIYPSDIAELKFCMAKNMINANKEPLRIELRDI